MFETDRQLIGGWQPACRNDRCRRPRSVPRIVGSRLVANPVYIGLRDCSSMPPLVQWAESSTITRAVDRGPGAVSVLVVSDVVRAG
jgi:hypothetical protein